MGGHYHHHGIKHFLGHRITRWEKREKEKKETRQKKRIKKLACLDASQSFIVQCSIIHDIHSMESPSQNTPHRITDQRGTVLKKKIDIL